MTVLVHPVVGELKPDGASEFLGSGFMRFESTTGVNGLAKADGRKIEILAVVSVEKERGHFRLFIQRCKDEYDFIRFWALMNPHLEVILARYGFVGGHDVDQFGEMVDVMDWSNGRDK